MVFNTIGVRHTATESRKQAEQARLSRQDGQIALMTSLSTFLQDTDLALEQTRAGEKVCDPTIRLTRRERFAIRRVVRNYDYLAWLFNQPTWDLDAATNYWSPHMVQAYVIASTVLSQPEVARRYVQLERFRVTRPQPVPDCGR